MPDWCCLEMLELERLVLCCALLKSNLLISGAAFFSQTLVVNDATVKFQIWDTTDQKRYHSLAPMYYKGASAAIIVHDITNQAKVYQ
ncbi:hypothetical protein Pint_06770 [Pistacia integerrima]|uniref:Uncharacterized protein n=1 Tax=Pistacia integerrima TaxID=434235 RepID=A0ACC0XSB7_9ROSI|nr:hypothetical protein Pint_06770 [Pistacia integerrima]